MRIRSVRIQNFRSFDDETIDLGSYTTLLGPNGAGKSTVLCALNVFFRETAESRLNLLELQEEDFHKRRVETPIEITVTFEGLSDHALETFKDYARQGQLIIKAKAIFDPQRKRAEVFQFGSRLGHPDFAEYFKRDSESAPANELKAIFASLREKYPELADAKTKPQMVDALRTYEAAHPADTIPLDSSDQFYGFTRGSNRMERFVQWIYVPAVKDAATEQVEAKDTALGKLLARTIRSRVAFDEKLAAIRQAAQEEYRAMLTEKEAELTELSQSIAAKLADWAHPGATARLQWQQDSDKAIRLEQPIAELLAGEDGFVGNVARLGHGLQRAYLLAILHELSEHNTEEQPTLILGIEEPELYQHPPQCRHLSGVLQHLAEQGSQMVVTTHSPLFVPSDQFSCVRMFRKRSEQGSARCTSVTAERLTEIVATARGDLPPAREPGQNARLYAALRPEICEIFFTPKLVLVEGREDISYIRTYISLMGMANEFLRSGCHLVAVDKKSHLLTPYAAVRELKIPTFLMFDADAHLPDRNGLRDFHSVDNRALLRAAGMPNQNPFPDDTLMTDTLVMWRSEIGREVCADFAAQELEIVQEETRAEYGHVAGLDKNPLFIADWLSKGWVRDLRSARLMRACDRIVAFCTANQ